MIIKIFAKTDIPFSLQGIRRGPLSESDCSSLFIVNRSRVLHTLDFSLEKFQLEFYFICMYVFNILPTSKVIQRQGHSLKSHLTDWKSSGSVTPGLQGEHFT